LSNAKLITLMVLMVTLITGSALAGDGYKMYGKLHLSVDMLNDSEDSQIQLSNNTSRFGVKGASEMNEDFTLFWKFESAINLAQKSGFTGLATRNSYIGFKHEFGALLVGIHDTPYKTLGRKSTFFFDELGDHRQTTMGWDRRLEEVVMFTTKNYEGFTASAMYQLDQNAFGALEAANTMSFNGMYKKDEFFFGAAIEMMSMGNYGMGYDTDMDGVDDFWGYGDYTYDMTDPDNPIITGWDTASQVEPEAPMGMRFGFGYTAEEFGVRGYFQSLSNVGGVKDLSSTTMGGEAKYHVNADYAVKGAYYMADPDGDTDDDEYAMLALGLDRNFGKSQYVYLQYVMTMNGDASMASVGGPGHGTSIHAYELGESPFGISAGVVKKW
jgi:predicted porin